MNTKIDEIRIFVECLKRINYTFSWKVIIALYRANLVVLNED